MRSSQILFIFVASATLDATASAQSVQESCAALLAETTAAEREIRAETDAWQRLNEARTNAYRRLQAFEGTSGNPVMALLLEQEAYSTRGMLRFREEFALPTEFNGYATAVRPEEFWRQAAAELKRRVDDERGVTRIMRANKRWTAAREEYLDLDCDFLPKDPSGPLPVDRRPDGQPIVTNGLITRWIRARYAQSVSGGAYWQAGEMTAQDFVDVAKRMQSYVELSRTGRQAEQFSDDEMRVIIGRWPDIDNTLQGNWSRVQLR